MDLGIKGKAALVCGASRGLGRACALSLAREGARVTIASRTRQSIEKTADELRALTGATIIAVAADVTTEEGRSTLLAACPNPDILITNAGGPPAGDFRTFTHDDWIRALNANMLSPIELIKATVDGMIARKFGRIVNITSGSVKHPLEVLGLSNGARSGLTGFVGGIARQVARHNVTINNILPGFYVTERSRTTMTAMGEKSGKSFDQMVTERITHIPAGRSGDPAEFGDACAYLCSAQAGYIVGQNFLVDGGAYPGTF
jgi:3-oxoacyl-[acyl-carrier protein] reductase